MHLTLGVSVFFKVVFNLLESTFSRGCIVSTSFYNKSETIIQRFLKN